jgi:hypothetical protein
MLGQQWEYCQLVLHGVKEHKRDRRSSKDGWSFNCYMVYLGLAAEGMVRFVTLTELDKQILSFNPFLRAILLLGAAEWELVSVHHGLRLTQGRYGLVEAFAPHSDYAVAYFKRVVEPDRDVTDPSIDIIQGKLVPKQSHNE